MYSFYPTSTSHFLRILCSMDHNTDRNIHHSILGHICSYSSHHRIAFRTIFLSGSTFCHTVSRTLSLVCLPSSSRPTSRGRLRTSYDPSTETSLSLHSGRYLYVGLPAPNLGRVYTLSVNLLLVFTVFQFT